MHGGPDDKGCGSWIEEQEGKPIRMCALCVLQIEGKVPAYE